MKTYRNEDGVVSYETIESESCSLETLQNDFYPAKNEAVQNQVLFNRQKLRCLKQEKDGQSQHSAVFGESDDPNSQTFSIYLASCDTLEYPNCKTPDEVTEWLKHKYLFLAYTERRFSHETGDVIEESKFQRIPISSTQDTNYKFQLQVTHLKDLDTGYMPFSQPSHYDFYNIIRVPDQPLVDRPPESEYTVYYASRFQISFEVCPEQIEMHVLP